MLELYNFAQSTCSLKVRLCLALKGVEWTDRRLISKDHDHLSDWYLKLNPNGVVPTLVHDGRAIFESSAILQYLDEVFPMPSFSPADPVERSHMRAFLTFADMVTTPAVRYPPFQYGGLRVKFQQMTQAEFEDKIRARPLKTAFYRGMDRETGFLPEVMAEAMANLRRSAARMELLLQRNGGPWLMGKVLTLADICVAPLLDRVEDLGLEAIWEDEYPSVGPWLAAVQALPGYAETFYKGSRLSDQFPELRLGRGANRDEALLRYPPAA
jgi:glutathione S-transferase